MKRYSGGNMYILEITTKDKLKTSAKKVREALAKSGLEAEFEVYELKEKSIGLRVNSESELNKILSFILMLKMQQKIITYEGLKINVDSVKANKYEAPTIGDKINILFEKEVLFKIGSNFKSDFSLYLMLDWLAKKYNKTGVEEKIYITPELVSDIIYEEKLDASPIDVKGYLAPAFIGEIILDLTKVEEKSKIKTLLSYGLANGVGYNSQKGYGRIRIKSI